jgi:hypothetical protein
MSVLDELEAERARRRRLDDRIANLGYIATSKGARSGSGPEPAVPAARSSPPARFAVASRGNSMVRSSMIFWHEFGRILAWMVGIVAALLLLGLLITLVQVIGGA